MSDPGASAPMQFTTGPPETVLPPEEPAALAGLAQALTLDPETRRAAIAAVVASSPRFLDGWAQLGNAARDDIEAYAAYRVGYHRGLDRLRQNGWRGSGYVRWRYETNRGFLRCMAGLAAKAAAIDEQDEAERCRLFLQQCDPSWPPSDFS